MKKPIIITLVAVLLMIVLFQARRNSHSNQTTGSVLLVSPSIQGNVASPPIARPFAKMIARKEAVSWATLIAKSGADEHCKKQWGELLSPTLTSKRVVEMAQGGTKCKHSIQSMNGLWEIIKKTCNGSAEGENSLTGVCGTAFKNYYDTLTAQLTKSLPAKSLKSIDTLKVRVQMELQSQSPELANETIQRIRELEPDNLFAKTFELFLQPTSLLTQAERMDFNDQVSQLKDQFSEDSGMRGIIDSWHNLKIGKPRAALAALKTTTDWHPLIVEYNVLTALVKLDLAKNTKRYDSVFLSIVSQASTSTDP